MDSLASRANHLVLLGCALLCAAALSCAAASPWCGAAEQPVAASPRRRRCRFPVASDARLAGDGKQTRFVLDLDQAITFRAFRWPIRIGWSSISRRSTFSFPPGAGTAGRGLIKAFRYGLVMPGGSRIVFDLTGPARIANSYVLDAANGQPPRLVLELEEVDRTTFVQSLAAESRPELRPAIADAADRRCRRRSGAPRSKPAAAAGFASRDRDRSRPWRHRQWHPVGWRKRKEPGAGIWAGIARPHREERQIPRRHDPDRRYLHPARRPGPDRAQSIGGAVCLDPCRRVAARRGRRPGRDDLHAVRPAPPTPRPNGWPRPKTRPTPSAAST